MAINEWKIWKKVGIVEEEREEVKVKDDLDAVIAFLKEMDVKELISKLERMGEMAKEEGVVDDGLKAENLEKQIELFDEILQGYDFFESDADVNGLRLQKIGSELLRKAKEKGMTDLVKVKKKDIKWR
jgi:hypothetical protein